jgi:hypothetical protein
VKVRNVSSLKEQDQRKVWQNQAGPSLQLEAPAETVLPDHGELRAGDLCPRCGKAHLDYDGLLNLACPECGYSLGGCFT